MARKKRAKTRTHRDRGLTSTAHAQTNAAHIQAKQYWASGSLDKALQKYQQLIATAPNNTSFYIEFGSLLWQTGNLKGARNAYETAIRISPQHADAHCNLGAVVWRMSRTQEAIQHFTSALRINPRHTGAMFNLAGALLQEGNCEEAILWFEKVLQLEPNKAAAWMYKGNAHYERGEFELAIHCYKKQDALAPSGGCKVRLAAAIPMIPDSTQHIEEIRNGFMSGIQQLIESGVTISDPVVENGYTNFFLAYHGCDDQPLQRKYAEFYQQACPALNFTAKHCISPTEKPPHRKIHVGFISKYLKGHSIGKTSRGIIQHLDRELFLVTAIFLSPPTDPTSKSIAAAADDVVILPNNLPAARILIESKQLDILFYQDTGMDPFTFFLAFSRLAPIQCTSFGHPVTSGIPNMDYYISTELWEPENGDDHYSESLVRLSGVASVAYYYKPDKPSKKRSRRYFGLPDQATIYICPQTLFKFHPDFDRLLAEILYKDCNGLIVLIEGKHSPWADILRRRFAKTIPRAADRIQFVPRQNGEDYINLLSVADVMLDTIHFCGFNTTLEGFSAGLAVVTLPGTYMRSRHTAAFYQRMGYAECVANNIQEYVDTAVRLGTDLVYRQKVTKKIRERLDILWEEIEVVREFETAFKSMHQINVEKQPG